MSECGTLETFSFWLLAPDVPPSFSIPGSILHPEASHNCTWTPQPAWPLSIHMLPTDNLYRDIFEYRDELGRQTQGSLGIKLQVTCIGNSRAQARREVVSTGKNVPLALQTPYPVERGTAFWSTGPDRGPSCLVKGQDYYLVSSTSGHLTNYLGCLLDKHINSELPNQNIIGK